MLHPDTRLDAAVPEYDIQELGQFAGNDLHGIADDCGKAFLIRSFKLFDAAEHMVANDAFRHLVRRKFHGLFDADVLGLGAGLGLISEDTVCYGKSFAGKMGCGSTGLFNNHGGFQIGESSLIIHNHLFRVHETLALQSLCLCSAVDRHHTGFCELLFGYIEFPSNH